MAGFFMRRTEGAHSSGEQRHFILKNTGTFTIGDAVRLASGFIDLATNSGQRVLGVIEGFLDKNGLPLTAQHRTGSDYTVSGQGPTETVVTASDNQTDSMVVAVVNVDSRAEYYNDADGSLTQAMIGTYFDVLAAGDQIASSTTGSTGQFILTEIDPDRDADLSKGIFRIAESALHLG